MKQYPSIQKIHINNVPNIYFYLFNKVDGSQIRSGWNSKKGFYKFGTKSQLIDQETMPFGRAIPLIREKYEEDLSAIFNENKWREVSCFFEFFGPSSFAGTHDFEEKMDVILFDVAPYKEGLLHPTKFIKYFGHLDVPNILYEGHITHQVIESIKNGILPGISFEGCVCKGANDKKTKEPIMFKIKTQAWLDRLKNHCGQNNSLFNELA